MRATEHAPRGPFHLLERIHGLAEIVERGAMLTLVALCIAPCVTPALFPDDDDAEDDPVDKGGEDPEEEAKERESVSSEGSAAPAGDEPATWHGSSVEVDDLWPGTTAPAQEVPPRSLEL